MLGFKVKRLLEKRPLSEEDYEESKLPAREQPSLWDPESFGT